MNRRVFWGVVAAIPWLLYGRFAHAQNRVPRIGLLERASPGGQRWLEGFREGLHELGYIEGKDVLIEERRTLGYEAELRPLVAELVQMNVDLIVTTSTPAAHAALEATKTIPVVFIAVGDPVATGLVPSLARPGGQRHGGVGALARIGHQTPGSTAPDRSSCKAGGLPSRPGKSKSGSWG